MLKAQDSSFGDIRLGQTAEFTVLLTDEMVADFARLSGDNNPLHMDAAFAAKSTFGKRVVHGMLGASFFSRLIGMYLPGKRALYLSQSLRFEAPLYIGMQLLIRGTVVQKVEAVHTLKMRTEVFDGATDTCLISGEALAKVV